MRKRDSPERLASPEQLDRLLVVIRPPGWIALLCIVVLILGIVLWSIFGHLPITINGTGILFRPQSIEVIQSKMPGIIKDIYVKTGDVVQKEAPLLAIDTLYSQDQIQLIRAPNQGSILMINILRGEGVHFGKNLLWLQKTETDAQEMVYGFFPIKQGEQIRSGMRAHIVFDSVRTEVYGSLEGQIQQILPFAASAQSEILQSIPSSSLRNYLMQKEASVIVLIKPTRDPTTPSGYKWTTPQGPPERIQSGSVAEIKVFLEERRPITWILPIGRH